MTDGRGVTTLWPAGSRMLLLFSSLPQQTVFEDSVIVAPRSELPATNAAKLQVVSGEELRRSGERSLPRAIGATTGIWIQESNLGGGAPVIRGLLGNQVLIVVDGVRLNDSTTRFGPNQSLNTIDPAIVERVEVIHGPASVLYGSDAIGGVILIWTRRRPAERKSGDPALHGAASSLYDSSTDGLRGSLELEGASERVGWLGIVSAEDWDDLEAGEDTEQPFTGYHGNAAFGSVDWALDAARTLRLTAWNHRDFDVPRTFDVVPGFGQTEPSFAQSDFALQEREQALLTFDDQEEGGLVDRAELRLFVKKYEEHRERRRTGSTIQASGETRVDTAGLGADWSRSAGERQRWTWGLDFTYDDVDSSEVRTDLSNGTTTQGNGDFAPNARYESFGAFAQDEIKLSAPADLTLGLRWSFYDFAFDDDEGGRERGDFSDLTGSAQLAYDLSEEIELTALLAQGFQAPNLEDLANDGDFAGGTELANPDLDPAQSVTSELGVNVLEERWSGAAAVFFTRIEDAIGRHLIDEGDPGVSGDETYMRANAGRLDLWGTELTGAHELGGQDSPWSLEGLASWVRGRQYDDTVDPNTGEAPLDGVEARRVPPVNGQLALVWREPERTQDWLDEGRLTFVWALDQDQLHPQDETDPRIDPEGTDGWTTWNLDFTGLVVPGVRWSLSLVNLLDELYRVHGSGIDGPGRSVVAGLRAAF